VACAVKTRKYHFVSCSLNRRDQVFRQEDYIKGDHPGYTCTSVNKLSGTVCGVVNMVLYCRSHERRKFLVG
jgi:hypothetical protein